MHLSVIVPFDVGEFFELIGTGPEDSICVRLLPGAILQQWRFIFTRMRLGWRGCGFFKRAVEPGAGIGETIISAIQILLQDFETRHLGRPINRSPMVSHALNTYVCSGRSFALPRLTLRFPMDDVSLCMISGKHEDVLFWAKLLEEDVVQWLRKINGPNNYDFME